MDHKPRGRGTPLRRALVPGGEKWDYFLNLLPWDAVLAFGCDMPRGVDFELSEQSARLYTDFVRLCMCLFCVLYVCMYVCVWRACARVLFVLCTCMCSRSIYCVKEVNGTVWGIFCLLFSWIIQPLHGPFVMLLCEDLCLVDLFTHMYTHAGSFAMNSLFFSISSRSQSG